MIKAAEDELIEKHWDWWFVMHAEHFSVVNHVASDFS